MERKRKRERSTYSKDKLAYTIIEANNFQDLYSPSWRPRTANDVPVQSLVGLKLRRNQRQGEN